jgi:hypothetical protein
MAVDAKPIGWRAWYAEGGYYDSTLMEWEELPTDGVLFVIIYWRTRPHCRIMSGKSLYWKDGDIYAYDDAADAITPKDDRLVKRGKWVTDQEYQDVQQEVMAAQTIAPDESLRVDDGD